MTWILEIALIILAVFCFFIGIDHARYFDFGTGIVSILLGLVLGFIAIFPFL